MESTSRNDEVFFETHDESVGEERGVGEFRAIIVISRQNIYYRFIKISSKAR